MLSLFLNPAVLCILVWLVARHTAEFDFVRMFFIALGVGIAGAVLGKWIGGYLALVALLPVLGLLAYLLMKYCYLTLQQALIVTGLYLAYQVVFAALIGSLLK